MTAYSWLIFTLKSLFCTIKLQIKLQIVHACNIHMHTHFYYFLLTDIEEERHEKEKLSPLSPMTTAQVIRQTGFKASNKAPQKVLFIDHLTRILCEYLPDLWRLGQSYFSGKLLKEV